MSDKFYGVTTPEDSPITAIRKVNGVLEGADESGEFTPLRGGGQLTRS